jgi:formylglycine-generating enzyme required for sulfatase activity
VIRGGSSVNGSNLVRSSLRYLDTPGITNYNSGFRVAKTP